MPDPKPNPIFEAYKAIHKFKWEQLDKEAQNTKNKNPANKPGSAGIVNQLNDTLKNGTSVPDIDVQSKNDGYKPPPENKKSAGKPKKFEDVVQKQKEVIKQNAKNVAKGKITPGQAHAAYIDPKGVQKVPIDAIKSGAQMPQTAVSPASPVASLSKSPLVQSAKGHAVPAAAGAGIQFVLDLAQGEDLGKAAAKAAGAGAGAAAGGAAASAIGAALTLPAGGVGAAVLGTAGAAAGSIGGAIAGGLLYDFFNPDKKPEPTIKSPEPKTFFKPSFSGGQCPILYLIKGTYDYVNIVPQSTGEPTITKGTNKWEIAAYGAIISANIVKTAKGHKLYVLAHGNQFTGRTTTPIELIVSEHYNSPIANWNNVTISGISTFNNQPDNCGNPPPNLDTFMGATIAPILETLPTNPPLSSYPGGVDPKFTPDLFPGSTDPLAITPTQQQPYIGVPGETPIGVNNGTDPPFTISSGNDPFQLFIPTGSSDTNVGLGFSPNKDGSITLTSPGTTSITITIPGMEPITIDPTGNNAPKGVGQNVFEPTILTPTPLGEKSTITFNTPAIPAPTPTSVPVPAPTPTKIPTPITPSSITPTPTKTPITTTTTAPTFDFTSLDPIKNPFILAGIIPVLNNIATNTTPAAIQKATQTGTCNTLKPGNCMSNLNTNAQIAANNTQSINDILAAMLLGLSAILANTETIKSTTSTINTKTDTVTTKVDNTANDVKTVDAKLGLAIPGGIGAGVTGITTAVTNLGKWLLIDRVLGLLNLIANLHNAYMLSNSLANTLLEMLSSVGNATGLLEDKDGESVDLTEILNKGINSFFELLLGKELVTDITTSWKKYNRIYQAAANSLNAISEMFNSIGNVIELTANQLGRVGNALKAAGAVGENAYAWLSEKVNAKMSRFITFEKKTGNVIEALELITEISESVVEGQQAATEFQKANTEFVKAVKDAQRSDSIENDKVKEAEVAAKKVAADAANPTKDDSDEDAAKGLFSFLVNE